MNSRITALCFLTLWVVPLLIAQTGQNGTDTLKTYTINPVYVTGVKFSTNRNDIPLGISAMPVAPIPETSSPSVPALLTNEIPGLFVTERSNAGFGVGSGAAGTMSIRGIGGSPNTDVLVLIDGRPDFMGMMGHTLGDAYSIDNVDHVEVIRGPASYLYGTNAMGGAINIITRRSEIPGIRTGFSLQSGTFNTQQASFNNGWKNDNVEYYVTGRYYTTDGDRPYSSFRSRAASASTAVQMNENFSLSLAGSVTNFNAMDPGTVTDPLINNWADVTRGGFNADIVNHFTRAEGAVKFHGNFGSHRMYDGWHSTDDVIGMMLYESFNPVEGQTATIGFDLKSYGGDAENTLSQYSFGSHVVTEYAPYIHLQQKEGDFVFSGAVRAEHNSNFGTEVIPYAGVTFQPGESSTLLRAVASKGFRSPTIRELYLFPAPTPDLQPERLWNYELGVVQSISSTVSGELTVYQNEGSNFIRVEGNWPNLVLRNSGSFRHRGVEAQVNAHLARNFDVTGNYSWLDPGEETYASPKTKFGSHLRYHDEHLAAGLTGTFIGGLYGDDRHQLALDNFFMIGANVQYRVMDHLAVTGIAENLLNVSYQMIYGYPLPGRNYSFGLTTTF
jgi:outer membrane cobalamin receptor